MAVADLGPGPIGVAVSGGGDSLALLHMCLDQGLALHAVTVDHGLRPEARQEANYVAELCARLGVPHDILTWNSPPIGNLQAAARTARYELMAEWARQNGLATIALGHTQDDVAETFLMRLTRKAGLDGLAAMQNSFSRHGLTWQRPLLSHTRNELRNYLKAKGQTWIDDPSNKDLRFDRVRARQMLAELEAQGLAQSMLATSAQSLRRARSALWYYIKKEARAHISEDRGDLVLDLTGSLPEEVEWHLFALALTWVGGRTYTPRTSAYEEMRQRLSEHKKHTLSGCLLTHTDQTTRITRELNAVKNQSAGIGQIWDKRWRITGPAEPGYSVRALGQGIADLADWRSSGLPYNSLQSSPAIWHDDALISAPLADPNAKWQAIFHVSFTTYLDSH